MTLFRNFSRAIVFSFVSLSVLSSARAEFVYLREDSIDTRGFPNPPVKASSEDASDLDGVVRIQSSRTRAECKRATDESFASLTSFYGLDHAILSRDELAAVNRLYIEVARDSDEFIHSLKKTYRRVRPYLRDSRVSLCVPPPGGYSYPSGHATLGRVSAHVLALLFPNRAEALYRRGDEVGLDRVIGGVHHPKDIQAGRLLGDQVFSALKKSSEFMRRIDEVRATLPRFDDRR